MRLDLCYSFPLRARGGGVGPEDPSEPSRLVVFARCEGILDIEGAGAGSVESTAPHSSLTPKSPLSSWAGVKPPSMESSVAVMLQGTPFAECCSMIARMFCSLLHLNNPDTLSREPAWLPPCQEPPRNAFTRMASPRATSLVDPAAAAQAFLPTERVLACLICLIWTESARGRVSSRLMNL